MKQDLNQLFTETITKSTESIIFAFTEINKIIMKLKGPSANISTEPLQNVLAANKAPEDKGNKDDNDSRQIDKVLKANAAKKAKAQEKEFNELKEKVQLRKKKKEEEKAAQVMKPQEENKKQIIQPNTEHQKENIQTKEATHSTPISKPKMPISPYLRFTKAQTETLKKDHPQANQTEITTIISTLWANLSEQDKKKYEDEFALDKQKYDKDLMAYYQQSPQQKKEAKSRHKKKKAANHEFI